MERDGPTFIEADTYRYRGHFEGDQQPYRTDDDIAIWKDNDAIEKFKERLIDAGTITESEFEEMESEISEQVEEAAKKAKEADYPDPNEAYDDMFNANVPEINDFAQRMRTDGGENQ
nr:thiamine pyrophosphate-dependent enzyme [Haladaptatus sp. W1]